MSNSKKFAEEKREEVRNIIKEISGFGYVEEVLNNVTGIEQICKNDSSEISPLDINYEFTYKKERYRLSAVAINLDYNTGNYHAFPGIYQLMKTSEKPMYLDNVKKRNLDIKVINEENPRIMEYIVKYNKTVKKNNMPILFGNGCDAETQNELNNSLLYWLNAENLFNRCVFDLAVLTNNKYTELYKLAIEFLDENNIEHKEINGRGNCKNYSYYVDLDKNTILSPLTYNGGGIYKSKTSMKV